MTRRREDYTDCICETLTWKQVRMKFREGWVKEETDNERSRNV